MITRVSVEPDFISIKERQKLLLKHYERLNEIKHSERKIVTTRSSSNIKRKPHLDIGKKLEIVRDNKALLNKLTHITNRKSDLTVSHSDFAKNIKSLNLPYRKKEAQRIDNENAKIAKRLFKQKAQINKKKLDKDFEKFKKYRSLLSKSRLLKLQENCFSIPIIADRRERSLTPVQNSFTLYTERDCITPNSLMYSKEKRKSSDFID